MEENKAFLQFVRFVAISGVGGLLLSLTGLSIGWMIGTLLMATFLSILRSKFWKVPHNQKGIPKYWLYIGQCILGIELGQKINSSVLFIFQENWATILIMLLLSIFFSLLSGFVLWKYSKLDMLTSFFATAPGGMSSLPSIAEDVGANTGIVSIIQTMRVFLVILAIPLIISLWIGNSVDFENSHTASTESTNFEIEQLLWTVALVLTAWVGYYFGKYLKFPAPWLIGSMVSVAIVKSFSSVFIGFDLVAWWPQGFIVVSQIFIGASIGSRFHKNMFRGLKRTLFISFLSTIGLILSMFLCAFIVSTVTGIPFHTSALAFAPGGIAEMTTTAVVLEADSTFVVAVQVLRVVAVCLILPPIFRFLRHWELKKKTHSRISA
ncbi:AbrB family transcriptional regulator [Metabacillus arenae]|uniref:AbrB family transcriptional regulator n=1 Tax=Metabacillus arenae TaxID=2771434 RepID=A0A926NN81_9BACI|nr:AbrB family transcriptional regulator [Metabacillus arenae]MBD1381087.1 AbrB family transcriptional regulator [Metabacillus arenae]